ncbi:MAG: hypothetical protein IPK19_25110 [Chloroflexi bacterium]|nr:hypothetical protein [Chloroflexota bacterium]
MNVLADYEIGTFSQLVQSLDWVGFHVNRLYQTTEGELTAMVQHWTMLAPVGEMPGDDASMPPARSWHGLGITGQSRRRAMAHSKALRVLRRDLEDEYGFLEVKAPLPDLTLQGRTVSDMMSGPASSYPNATVDTYLTDLLVGGLEAVYDVVSLKTPMSDAGLPALSEQVLHCCLAPAEITDMMSLAERLAGDVADEVRSLVVNADDMPFDFKALQLGLNWRRQSLIGLVQVETGRDFLHMHSLQQAAEVARSVGVDAQHCETIEAVAVYIAEQLVYPQLREPTFLVDFPLTEFPHAKQDRHSTALAEMARLFIGGVCFGIAYTVQNDPRRLHELSAEAAMTHGLPPAGALCIHIDQLLSLLVDMDDPRERDF